MTSSQCGDSKPKTSSMDGDQDEAAVNKFNMKPVFVLMALSGCYSPQRTDRRTVSVLMWVYKVVLAVIVVLYAARTSTLLSNPVLILSALTSILLSLQSLGNMLICWRKFSKRHGNYSQAKNKLNKVISAMAINGLELDMAYFTKRRNIILVLTIFTIVFGTVAQVIVNFILLPMPGEQTEENGNYSDLMSVSYSRPFPDTLAARIVLFFALLLHLFPYTSPVFFLMTMSVMFLTVFKSLNKHIEDITQLDMEKLFSNFEPIRKIHAELCSTVQTFDKDLGFLYGNIFCWTVLEGIMVLFIVVKYPMPITVQMTLVYYLATAFFMLASISILAAMVHEAAHSPVDVIYTIDVKDEISLGKVTQLNLFLSRLTGPQVGFTTFGLLIITKEFILTISGAFLTYFAVLYTL